MIIAVDFDGTIVRSQYPTIQGEQPYAVETLKKLKDEGHYIIIWTCRTGQPLLDAMNWLLAHGVSFDRINDHCPANVATYGDAGNKIYADVYIDDHNVGGFPGWHDALEMILDKDIEETIYP